MPLDWTQLLNVREKKLLVKHSLLTTTASAHEPQIVEFGHLILHDGRAVAQLAAPILVVAGPNGDNGAVADVGQRDHFECNR